MEEKTDVTPTPPPVKDLKTSSDTLPPEPDPTDTAAWTRWFVQRHRETFDRLAE